MKFKTDTLFLILSLVIGFAIGFVLEICLRYVLPFSENRIMIMTIYIAAFALVMGLVLLLKGLSNGTFVNMGKVMLLTLLAFVALVGFTALFEYIYELDFQAMKKYSPKEMQYVFIVDDSGSMYDRFTVGDNQGNDSSGKRFDAVDEIINNLEETKNFAVYLFARDVKCVTKLGTESSKNYKMDDRGTRSNAGTPMLTAVETAMNDVCKGKDVHTKFIILTDGEAQDKEKYSSLIAEIKQNDASISSVGFGAPEDAFLQKMADETGGVYVRSDDLSSLGNDLDKVVKAKPVGLYKDRYLLGSRNDATAGNFLYALLRVVFLILLGLLWTVVKMLLVGEKKYTKKATVVSCILCSVAGILVELLCLPGLWVLGVLARILFCTLWACTIIPTVNYQPNLNNGNLHSEFSGRAIDAPSDLSSGSQGVDGPKSFL
ncbi:MAG: VWA domain-containing protein [Ruminococcaceae bacterium]|nr:VWA domain-containing protein [Oscillospiraceae bacterium]